MYKSIRSLLKDVDKMAEREDGGKMGFLVGSHSNGNRDSSKSIGILDLEPGPERKPVIAMPDSGFSAVDVDSSCTAGMC